MDWHSPNHHTDQIHNTIDMGRKGSQEWATKHCSIYRMLGRQLFIFIYATWSLSDPNLLKSDVWNQPILYSRVYTDYRIQWYMGGIYQKYSSGPILWGHGYRDHLYHTAQPIALVWITIWYWLDDGKLNSCQKYNENHFTTNKTFLIYSLGSAWNVPFEQWYIYYSTPVSQYNVNFSQSIFQYESQCPGLNQATIFLLNNDLFTYSFQTALAFWQPPFISTHESV